MPVRSWLAFLAVLCSATPAVCAETIFLNDGRELEATVLQRDAHGVTIRDMRTGRMVTLKRSEIDLILKAEAPPPVPPKPAAPVVRAPAGPVAKPAVAEKAVLPEEQPLPPAVQAVVDDAMPRLASLDPDERAVARQELLAQGPVIIPVLVTGLRDPSPELRTECAGMLGELHALNAAKAMIETFYAALPGEGQAAAYQRYFVRALSTALAKLSGQDEYATVEPKSPLVQKCLEQNIQWYDQNMTLLPRQIGEPEIPPTDPLYGEKLIALRKLKLEKGQWPRPPLSADIALGQRLTLPAEAPTTTTPDREFAKTIPTVDNRTMGGFLRPADVDFGKHFFDRGSEYARSIFTTLPTSRGPAFRY